MRILFISADEFEDSELLCPMYRFKEIGAQVDIAAPEWGEIKGKHGYAANANLGLDDVEPAAFDMLFLPGGKAPNRLRHIPEVREIVKDIFDAGKPVAAICHGPLILADAGLLQGKQATCYWRIEDQIRKAGAEYLNQPVVVDGNLITSRKPEDLPAFMRAIMKMIEEKGLLQIGRPE